jgi:serine/threonine protein kinase
MFEENGPVPKLADFGFAAFASNKLIEIVGTKHWLAPEIRSRRLHTLDQAKLSDIFSFGVLCLWVLFREELVKRGEDLTKPLPPKGLVASAVTTLSGVLKPIGRVLGFVDQDVSPDIQIIGAHNTFPKETNKIKTLALELVSGLPHTVWKERLEQLFMSALDTDTEKRAQSVEYLMRFLGDQR